MLIILGMLLLIIAVGAISACILSSRISRHEEYLENLKAKKRKSEILVGAIKQSISVRGNLEMETNYEWKSVDTSILPEVYAPDLLDGIEESED